MGDATVAGGGGDKSILIGRQQKVENNIKLPKKVILTIL